MTSFERLLTKIDAWPAGAFVRVGLGLCILPMFRLLAADGSSWMVLPLFLAMLLALRVVPAVLRWVLPFSREAKDLWFQRRNLAKRYDSYQWQKLFWIGLGMLPYALTARGIESGETVLLAICLIGGGAGLLLWRRAGVGQPGASTTAAGVAKLPAIAPAPR